MESRNFIKAAKELIVEMKDQTNLTSYEEAQVRAETIQRDLSRLLSGLTNPTLPSAVRLLEVAHEYGYRVDEDVRHAIYSAEKIWSY